MSINSLKRNISSVFMISFFVVLFLILSAVYSFASNCIGVCNNENGLNVRKSPSSEAMDIYCLYNGDAVEVLKSGHYWDEIKINSTKGYVLKDSLLKFSNKAQVSNQNGAILKKSPFKKSPELLKIDVNSEITILQGRDEYYKVSYADKIGYISMDDVKLFLYNNDIPQLKGIVKSNGIVVRKGKGISYRSCGYLRESSEFDILEYSNGWCKIRKDSIEGFIQIKFIDFLDGSYNMKEDTPISAKGEITFKKGGNLLEGPSIIYDRITFLKAGTKISVISKLENGWSKIKVGRHVGYIESIKIESEEIEKKEFESYSDVVVRVFPLVNSRSLGYIRKNTDVKVISFKDGWYKIEYKGGVGYIEKKYIKNNLLHPIYQSRDKILKRGFVISKGGCDVKASKNSPSNTIGHIDNGEDIYILEYVVGGYKIRFKDGIGYVSGSSVFIPSTCDVNNATKKGFIFVNEAVGVNCMPKYDSPKLGILNYGDNVDIVSRNGNFYKICYKGEVGYISVDTVYLKEYISQSDVKYYGFSFSNTPIDVRRGAGDIYPKLSQIVFGQKIGIVSEEGDWYKIKWGNEAGYVKKEKICLQVFVAEHHVKLHGFSYSKDPMYIKRGPDNKYPNIARIFYGEKINIISKNGDWFKIRYGNELGYIKDVKIVLQEYISYSHVQGMGVVSVNATIDVRRGADMIYPVMGRMKFKDHVQIISKIGAWYQIRYNNEVGYVQAKYVKVSSIEVHPLESYSYVNIRKGPGTNYAKVGRLEHGKKLMFIGRVPNSVWIKVRYNGETAYIHGGFVKLVINYIHDSDFEAALSRQGFPESYKKELRTLHTLYPKWVFKSRNSVDWNVALTAENARLANLIWKNAPSSWKKSDEIIESPSWVHASNALIAYALDPRNSLDSTHIFEFLSLNYNNNIDYNRNLDYVISGTFLGKGSYKNWINEIGRDYGVCPFFIVATIIQEQGSDGHGRSISGTVPGYEGLYNFFNIKAYQSGGNSSVVNGLIHARKMGWTTRYKSIAGGANFFKKGYLDRGQSNLYFKKFNIVNGHVSHQYMSNVMAAMSEAKTMAKAYTPLLDRTLVFEIPIYKNMPSTKYPMPK